MRMLTFSFLKRVKCKAFHSRLSRQLSTGADLLESDKINPAGDATLVRVSASWPEGEAPELRAAVRRDLRVLPAFVSEREEAALLAELEPYLKRMRYEFDHWDDAIQGYRETERSQWSPENAAVFRRVRQLAFARCEPLPHVHVLDLAPAGHVRPHVDAVRFCGDVIAGLSLLSCAVMRLRHRRHEHWAVDALLQRRALYILSGPLRYEFTHEVLGGPASRWGGEQLLRARRLALICRSKPRPQPAGS